MLPIIFYISTYRTFGSESVNGTLALVISSSRFNILPRLSLAPGINGRGNSTSSCRMQRFRLKGGTEWTFGRPGSLGGSGVGGVVQTFWRKSEKAKCSL